MKMLSLDDAIKAVTMLLDCETDIDKVWSCDVINNLQYAPSVTDIVPEQKWISVKDRLPEAGKHVLADCEVRFIGGRKIHYVCEAYYAPTHTISAGGLTDDDGCYEYDEMDDEYYLMEGWYECIHNWDDYSSVVIGDFVTHWMPMPEPPEGAVFE